MPLLHAVRGCVRRKGTDATPETREPPQLWLARNTGGRLCSACGAVHEYLTTTGCRPIASPHTGVLTPPGALASDYAEVYIEGWPVGAAEE